MHINQIILHNFRVYHGTNRIRLATDHERNITIISGNNGFGKTSFLTALVWCLYGKLMGDVDTRYRQEIYESGGYRAYCEKLMNRLAIDEEERFFSITVNFSDIMIPSVTCHDVQIKRTYDMALHQETVELLIDGKVNELTRQVGPEIFINDFILPKEIAKFFFFDAEKIVSLAEIKNSDEKVYLSQAYAEVLGIKKYTDLRANLLNTRLRLREKAAHKSDRDKLAKLQQQVQQNESLLNRFKQEIYDAQEELVSKKSLSDNFQIQLIREGSGLTVEEVHKLKEKQAELSQALQKLRHQFNELMELAPFAIAGNKIRLVKSQLEQEFNNSAVSASLLEQKFTEIKLSIESGRSLLRIAGTEEEALVALIKDILLPVQHTDQKILLDFTTEQYNRFNAIHDNLQNAYSKTFKQLVAEQKRLMFVLGTVQRKLQDAESKEQDVVIQGVRSQKQVVDNEIAALEDEVNQLEAKVFVTQQENQTLSRQLSELSKKVKMEDVDLEKDRVAERLIGELDKFIFHLKSKKKDSLEHSLTRELNRLMHKDFVHSVKVIVEGDLIDVELYDRDQRLINKDQLSKGEQQLYATALLKGLVDESHIRFPIFIDSPLQKFDKTHSRNIIQQFYPNISTQLILFPLLENELTAEEFALLLPKVGCAYLIRQTEKYHSTFVGAEPQQLFDLYSQTYVQ